MPLSINQNRCALFVCYEINRGGETIAIRSVIHEFNKDKRIELTEYASETFVDTEPIYLLRWIVRNLFYWLYSFCRNHKQTDWVITTTYTAGFIASLFKQLRKYNICFYYQGNRLPPEKQTLSLLRQVVYFFLRKTIFLLNLCFLIATDIVIVPSKYTRRELTDQYDFLKEKIIVIPNGIDTRIFQPISKKNRGILRKQFGLANDKKIILYIGRLHPQKGVLSLLEAYLSLLIEKKRLGLVIIHTQSNVEEEKLYERLLHQYIDNNRIKSVLFLNPDRHDIPAIYGISDLVVLPSLVDHFPLVMLEALASGVPFVATPVGAMKDVLSRIDPQLILTDNTARSITNGIKYALSYSEAEKIRTLRKAKTLTSVYAWSRISKKIYRVLRDFDNNGRNAGVRKI